MTSIELGETERIANQYCNGNLSKFIRDLVMNYHHKQTQKQEKQKTEKKMFFMQNIMFMVISATFLILGLSLQIDLLNSIAITLLIVSSSLIMILVVLNHKKYKIINGGI